MNNSPYCWFDVVPLDVMHLIMAHLSPDEAFPCLFVNKKFLTAANKHLGRPSRSRLLSLLRAFIKSLRQALSLATWLKYKLGKNISWPENGLSHAALTGDLGMLKWASDSGCILSTSPLLEMAARGGHLDTLQWLHQKIGSPILRDRVIAFAAQSGNLEVLRWSIANGNPETKNSFYPVFCAARVGHVHLLEDPQLSPFPQSAMIERVCLHAATAGQLLVLQWLVHKYAGLVNIKVIFNDFVIHRIRLAGHVHILNWLEEQGCRLAAAPPPDPDEQYPKTDSSAKLPDVCAYSDFEYVGNGIEFLDRFSLCSSFPFRMSFIIIYLILLHSFFAFVLFCSLLGPFFKHF